MYLDKDALYRNIGLHYLSANTVNANHCPHCLELGIQWLTLGFLALAVKSGFQRTLPEAHYGVAEKNRAGREFKRARQLWQYAAEESLPEEFRREN